MLIFLPIHLTEGTNPEYLGYVARRHALHKEELPRWQWTFPYYGTVSEGTMLPEHLIPAFSAVLDELDADQAAKLAREFAAWPQDDEAAQEYVMALFDVLDTYSPAGHYFGSHPGDGSDYGFWEVEE